MPLIDGMLVSGCTDCLFSMVTLIVADYLGFITK
jgi:hypothetical protein